MIYNPATATEQGVAVAESIWIDCVGIASRTSRTSAEVVPGQMFVVPPSVFPTTNMEIATNVTVWAPTGGHIFSAIAAQPPTQHPPTPIAGDGVWPPAGPTTRLETLPSYLYKEYNDDDTLQAFVDAQNAATQAYVDWFNGINLPIYTGLSDSLLDWVAQGLYGISRPTLSTGVRRCVGPLNTWPANTVGCNQFYFTTPNDVSATTDDVFKRIITWHFFKGDGKYFNVQWLKRRIMRFLFGANGTDFEGPAYQISVTFGANSQLNITILAGRRTFEKGAMCNFFGCNQYGPDAISTGLVTFTLPPLAYVFQEAAQSGALEMPFQYSPPVVRIGY
jgi:hypothetical protein